MADLLLMDRTRTDRDRYDLPLYEEHRGSRRRNPISVVAYHHGRYPNGADGWQQLSGFPVR